MIGVNKEILDFFLFHRFQLLLLSRAFVLEIIRIGRKQLYIK